MESLTPYEILQLPENSTFDSIKARYRTLVRILHPDKHIQNSGNDYVDNLSYDEKEAMFLAIQKAYVELRDLKGRETDVPDEEIEYEIPEELSNYMSEDMRHMNLEGNFDEDKFNKQFNEYKQKIKGTDPFEKGYNEFNFSNNTSTNYNTSFLDRESEKMYNKKRRKPSKEQEKMIECPSSMNSQTSFTGTFEFGLSNISDFGTTLGAKCNLNANDLKTAFDNPYFESIYSNTDTVMDKSDFDKAIQEKMSQRTNLDSKIESKEIYLSEEEELKKVRELNRVYEEKRKIQEKRDQKRVHRKIKDSELPRY